MMIEPKQIMMKYVGGGMRYIKLFLFLVFVFTGNFHTIALTPVGPLGQFVGAARGVIRLRSRAMMDINTWDSASFSDVANDMFHPNAFGANSNVGSVVHEMFYCFRHLPNKPHVALARIVIIGTDGKQYIYSIPRVFVSGRNKNMAIRKWSMRNVQGCCPNLTNAIIPQGGALPANGIPQPQPIEQIVKGIEDYGFSCASHGQYQCFAHSERSAILSILYDREYSIAEAIRKFNTRFPRVWISKLVIQIKIAHINGMCSSCKHFFDHHSKINPAYIHPIAQNAFGNQNNQRLGMFGSQQNAGYRTYEVRRDIANVLRVTQGHGSVPISLRISYVTTNPIPLMIPMAPLASSVQGF